MTKRMVIMLAAVVVVFGGVFGFQAFKAAMIKKFMSTMAQPPQTVTAGKANVSEWQPKIAAVGSLRAVSGADLSLEVSGVVETLAFNSGDDVDKGTVLLKLRSDDDAGQARIVAGHGRALHDHLRPRPETVQAPGGQPGHARYRCGEPEERQGAGGAAAGDPRQEIPARAVWRPSRPASGGSRPISRRRHRHRHLAGARSDLSSTSSCRSRRSIRCAWVSRSR